MIELYKLASLLNQFGDTETVAELTGIDEELIEAAIEEIKGEKALTQKQKDKIRTKYNSFYRSKTLSRSHLRENSDQAESLEFIVTRGISDNPDIDLLEPFVDDYINQEIDANLLKTAEAAFLDLTESQQYRLSEWRDETGENSIAKWLQLWANDTNYGSQPMQDIDASEFWEWFRETFYNE